MKKIKDKAKQKRNQVKKDRKRRTVAEQKERGGRYKLQIREKRDKEIKDFLQFAEFMDSVKKRQMSGEEFTPKVEDESAE